MQTEITQIRKYLRMYFNPKNNSEFQTARRFLDKIKMQYGTVDPDEIWEIIR